MEKIRMSEEVTNEAIKKLKTCESQWLVPADIESFMDVEPNERKIIKRVVELLVFRKALKFNKEYLLWENMYYEK